MFLCTGNKKTQYLCTSHQVFKYTSQITRFCLFCFQTGQSTLWHHGAESYCHHMLRKSNSPLIIRLTSVVRLDSLGSLSPRPLQNSGPGRCDHNANTSELDKSRLSPCQPNSGHHNPHLQLFPDSQWEGRGTAAALSHFIHFHFAHLLVFEISVCVTESRQR